MRLIFENSVIEIELYDSEVAQIVADAYVHLQHIPLPWQPIDSPTYLRDLSIGKRVFELWKQAKSIGITVDVARCLRPDQSYFNDLHAIIEKNYAFGAEWLKFHDLVHACESTQKFDVIHINYREVAGPLQQVFNRDWLGNAVTKVHAGQVFCSWSELGKTPYIYWLNREPNDIDRILELVKPWTILHPRLMIALSDIDFVPAKDINDFEKWWSQYSATWCQAMDIDAWIPDEQFSVIPIGQIGDLNALLCEIESKRSRPLGMQINYTHNETLGIEIHLGCNWTTHAPSAEIFVDQIPIGKHILDCGETKLRYQHRFAPGEHTLKIARDGATSDDPSQMVTIKKIMIGNLDCDQLILKHSYFLPDYPEPWATEQRRQGIELPTKVPFETWLGHNGEWSMEFASPFYPVFLDSISQSS